MLLFLRRVQQDSHEHLLQSKFQQSRDSIFFFFFFKKITSQQLLVYSERKCPLTSQHQLKPLFLKKIKVENKLKVSQLENEGLMCLQRATHFQGWGSKKKKAGWGWLLASLLVNDGSFRLLRVRKRQRKKKRPSARINHCHIIRWILIGRK